MLKKSFSCFDRACPELVEGLSTNGKSPTIALPAPFALSLSKGERRVFQHPPIPAIALGLCDRFQQLIHVCTRQAKRCCHAWMRDLALEGVEPAP